MKNIKSIEEFLFESKSSAKKRFLVRGLISEEVFNTFLEVDITPTKKFIEKMCEFFVSGSSEEEIIETFEKAISLFERNILTFDVSLIKSLSELQSLISEKEGYKSRSEKRFISQQGAEVTYEDDRFLVLYITTEEASKKYGKGTQWCISAEDKNQWDNYYKRDESRFYFMLDKSLPESDPLHKIAFEFKKFEIEDNLVIDTYDAEDVPDTFDGTYLKDIGLPENVFKYHPNFSYDDIHSGVNKRDLMDIESPYFYPIYEWLSSNGVEYGDIEIVDVDYEDGGGDVYVNSYEVSISGDLRIASINDDVARILKITKVEGNLVIFDENGDDSFTFLSNPIEVGGDIAFVGTSHFDWSNCPDIEIGTYKEISVELDQITSDSVDYFLHRLYKFRSNHECQINLSASRFFDISFIENYASTSLSKFLLMISTGFINLENLTTGYTNSTDIDEYINDQDFDEEQQDLINKFYQLLNAYEYNNNLGENIINLTGGNYINVKGLTELPDLFVLGGKLIHKIDTWLSPVMDCAGKGITEVTHNFPDVIGNPAELGDLILDNNDIKNFLFKIPVCKKLSLAHNKIKDIKSLYPSKYIQELDLTGNLLENVDGILEIYPNLKKLTLGKQANGKVIEYDLVDSGASQQQIKFLQDNNLDIDYSVDGKVVINGNIEIGENEDIYIDNKNGINELNGNLSFRYTDFTKPFSYNKMPKTINGNLEFKYCSGLEDFTKFPYSDLGDNNAFGFLKMGGNFKYIRLNELEDLKSLDGLRVTPLSTGSHKLQIYGCHSLIDTSYTLGRSLYSPLQELTIRNCNSLEEVSFVHSIGSSVAIKGDTNIGLVELPNFKRIVNTWGTHGQRDLEFKEMAINQCGGKFSDFTFLHKNSKVYNGTIRFMRMDFSGVQDFKSLPVCQSEIIFEKCRLPENIKNIEDFTKHPELFTQEFFKYINLELVEIIIK